MKKFMVLYMMPIAGMEEWMKKPEAERKDAETKMKSEWGEWMKAHASAVLSTEALGKTKRVTKGAVADAKNDLMLYSLVQGESAEAVAELFKDHPHLGIPEASIEIVEARPL